MSSISAASSRRTLLINVATNYAAVAWLAILSLALIPWYLRHLGSNQWGIVALSMSLQAIMYLLDSGLAQIMPRDIARVADDQEGLRRTLRSYEMAYGLLAALGFILGQALVHPVVDYWIAPPPGSEREVSMALRIVLIQFLFQFANNAHQGLWSGLQRQTTVSLRQCIFATLKHGASVTAIAVWEPTAVAYLVPFALVSSIEFALNRRAVGRLVPRVRHDLAHVSELKAFRREAPALSASIFLSVVLMNTDRIVLSSAVDVAAFGRYAIVANLGLAFLQLQGPVVRAFMPRIARARDSGEQRALKQMAAALGVLCVAPCAIAIIAAPWLLSLWTRDVAIVQDGALPLRLILGAVALGSLYQVHYQRLLARGAGSAIFRINILVGIVVLPLSPLVVGHYGIVGGGIIWLMITALQLVLGAALGRRAPR